MALRYFTLTVKGEPFQADAALAAHGLGGDHVADLGFEQVVKVACDEDQVSGRHGMIARLNNWFIEEIGDAPYPIGTLLYWSPGTQDPLDTYRRTRDTLATQELDAERVG